MFSELSMKYNIFYKDCDKEDSISLTKSPTKTVKSFKDDISTILPILPEYIVLKYENEILEDDKSMDYYKIADGSQVRLYIVIKVRTKRGQETLVTMNYGDRLKDLEKEYGKRTEERDVKIMTEINPSKDYLKDYLNCPDFVFLALLMVTINLTNEFGVVTSFEMFENDTIEIIKNKLIEMKTVESEDVLMLENEVLNDSLILTSLDSGKSKSFDIFVGFFILINQEKVLVNVNTKILSLKKKLSKNCRVDCKLISLVYESMDLQDEKTVACYKMKRNDSVQMVFNKVIIIWYPKDDKTIEYVTKNDQTIIDIKNDLSVEFDIEVKKIKLLYDDKELRNDFCINSLKFKLEEDIIFKMVEDQNDDGCDQVTEHLKDTDLVLSKDLIKPDIAKTVEGKCEKIEDPRNERMNFSLPYPENIETLKEEDLCLSQNVENGFISLMVINLTKDFSGPVFPRISVDPTCSIHLLKSSIYCQLRINMEGMDVYFLGDVVNGGTLEEYVTKDNCTLVLKLRKFRMRVGEQFFINVKTVRNNFTKVTENRLLIDDFQTVEGLKRLLREQHNVQVSKMKLFLEEEELQNKSVIRELDIESGCTLTLVLEEREERNVDKVQVTIRNSLEESDSESRKNMSVDTNDTVSKLKAKVENIFGLSSVKYVVSFAGQILKNENMLNIYDIKDGDEIVVSESLLVRYFSGTNENSARVNRYSFEKNDTVLKLKSKIHKSLNIETKFIKLSFNGILLEDTDSLEECGVENESYLMMITTLAGGGSLT